MTAVLSLAAMLAAGGCALYSETGERLSEQPTYQAGYGDGCSTALEEDKSFSTEKTRDSYLFDNDKAYRAGWRQGYLSCGARSLENESDGGLILGQENEY